MPGKRHKTHDGSRTRKRRADIAKRTRAPVIGTKKNGNPRVDGKAMLAPGKGRRPFAKGNPGKPPGTKDNLGPGSRSVKASIKAVIEEVTLNEGTTIRKALMDGIRGGARNADRYLKLMAEYTDGKPKDTLDLNVRDDELATAKQRLDRKMDTLLKAVLAKRATQQPTTE